MSECSSRAVSKCHLDIVRLSTAVDSRTSEGTDAPAVNGLYSADPAVDQASISVASLMIQMDVNEAKLCARVRDIPGVQVSARSHLRLSRDFVSEVTIVS